MAQQLGRKIAMVGATGTIGSRTLSALLEKQIHTITAVSRSESNATFPAKVNVNKGSYSDASFLVPALQGHDVLLIQLAYYPEAMESQVPLIEAAAKAGVKWVLPTQFGSNIYGPLAKQFPHMSSKTKYRDLIESLGMQWIAVVNNPWFDWSLERGLWSIDVPGRKATIFEGDAKFNTTTLAQVGRGIASLLSLPDEELEKYKNKPVYFSSFLVNQRNILDAAIRATGTTEDEWEVKTQAAKEAIAKSMEEAGRGNPMAIIWAYYASHMIEGNGGNFNDEAIKDAKVLGLRAESLDEAVTAVVQRLASN